MRTLWLLAFACALGSVGCRHSPAGTDAGPEADAGGGGDGAARADVGPVGGQCAVDYAGCVTFVDYRANISSTVGISMDGSSYGPACIRITAGAQVAILGTAAHPLLDAPCSPLDSPLPRAAPATGPASYRFPARGRYGYYSPMGGTADGTGLAGLIVVE